MKYIRTKDGIYEKAKYIYAYWENPNKNKEADTIEELCDEFIIEGKLYCYANCYKSLKHLKSSEVYELDKCNVYGTIWTDKGLIYVAKMNDEGELELI